MILPAVIAIVIALVLGLVVRAICNSNVDMGDIDWWEYGVVAVLMTVLITPSVLIVGRALAVDSLLVYEQFVNGVETRANDTITECYGGHRGSSYSAGQSNCTHTYVSGGYSWTETEFYTECTSDSKGNQSCTTKSRQVTHTASIYTPYATVEHSYSLDSSMGKAGSMNYRYKGVFLDANPVRFPESDYDVPGDIPRGAPGDWLDAKKHLDANDPRPVTMMAKYDNYVLASDDKVLATYSDKISEYRERGLLPDHTANILQNPITGPSASQANKVSFFDVKTDEDAWQKSVMRFNAALGMKLQGDLHVVLVNSDTISLNESIDYVQALKAYWQSDVFGRRALAKNGIVLVIGVNTSQNKIAWADATTGMPFGNELMVQYIRDELPGLSLNPETILGSPKTVIKGEDATITLSSTRGTLEKIMFESAPFMRARMSCGDGTCVGYKNLVEKIEPTFWQKFWIVLITDIIALGLWIFVASTEIVSDAVWSIKDRFSKDYDGKPLDDTPDGDDCYTDYYSTHNHRRHNG